MERICGYCPNLLIDGPARIYYKDGFSAACTWENGVQKDYCVYSKLEKGYTTPTHIRKERNGPFVAIRPGKVASILLEGSAAWEGETIDGVPNGNGEFLYNDEVVYRGCMIRGKFEGYGVEYTVDGDYEGEFHDGKRLGFGKFFPLDAPDDCIEGYWVGDSLLYPDSEENLIMNKAQPINPSINIFFEGLNAHAKVFIPGVSHSQAKIGGVLSTKAAPFTPSFLRPPPPVQEPVLDTHGLHYCVTSLHIQLCDIQVKTVDLRFFSFLMDLTIVCRRLVPQSISFSLNPPVSESLQALTFRGFAHKVDLKNVDKLFGVRSMVVDGYFPMEDKECSEYICLPQLESFCLDGDYDKRELNLSGFMNLKNAQVKSYSNIERIKYPQECLLEHLCLYGHLTDLRSIRLANMNHLKDITIGDEETKNCFDSFQSVGLFSIRSCPAFVEMICSAPFCRLERLTLEDLPVLYSLDIGECSLLNVSELVLINTPKLTMISLSEGSFQNLHKVLISGEYNSNAISAFIFETGAEPSVIS